MKNLAICDLDGTLADTREGIARAVNLMRADLGFKNQLAVDEVTSCVGDGAKMLVEKIFKGTSHNIDDAVRAFKVHYLEVMLYRCNLYPGVAEGLAILKSKGWECAVISNKPTEHCVKILDKLGILECFGKVIGGGAGFPLKPAPDSIIATMKAAGSTCESTWMIGDAINDLQAGRNAGVRCCYASYGFQKLDPKLFDCVVDEFVKFADSCGHNGN